MATAPRRAFGELAQCAWELRLVDVAQLFDVERAGGEFALLAAAAIFACRVRVADHRVDQEERVIFRQRQGLCFERATVEQKRACFNAVGAGELIHDAARHANEVVLGGLRPAGDGLAVGRDAGECGEGTSEGDLERRGGANAGSDRNVRVDPDVTAGNGHTGLHQDGSDACDVVGPLLLGLECAEL